MIISKPIKQTGFTLVELLIVVVIMATLASIVVPMFFNKSVESKIIAAKTTVKNIQKKIETHQVLHDQWPADIDRAWFITRRYPRSPFSPEYVGQSNNTADEPTNTHPQVKTPEEEGHPPFWYNSANGSFRMRVPTQSTVQQTLNLYNAVNDSYVTGMLDRTDAR